MRNMIDLRTTGPLGIIDTATSVDCSGNYSTTRRTLLRSLLSCIISPACFSHTYSSNINDHIVEITKNRHSKYSNIVAGTFFGYRHGRVSFCIHQRSSTPTLLTPLFLLDLPCPTSYLAHEMRHGDLLRIALECPRRASDELGSIYAAPTWAMYCNGRRIGFAVKRALTEADVAVMKLMKSVSAGAGVLPATNGTGAEGDVLYLRASFKRVVGSPDSESFHMINPVGSSEQELSIFLLRT